MVSVFQLIPLNLNPTDSWSTIAPLAILILFTLTKDAINDLYRSKEDNKMNSMLYECWTGNSFEQVKSKDLLVGNIILMHDGDVAPADMILLSSGSDEKNPYLDTTGIIGSTKFNVKRTIPNIQRFLSTDEESSLRKFQAIVYIKEPNTDFANFSGKLKLSGFPKAIEFGVEQALFRGAIIGGVPWITGVVVYAGCETKTILNTKNPPKKTSLVEKIINK